MRTRRTHGQRFTVSDDHNRTGNRDRRTLVWECRQTMNTPKMVEEGSGGTKLQ